MKQQQQGFTEKDLYKQDLMKKTDEELFSEVGYILNQIYARVNSIGRNWANLRVRFVHGYNDYLDKTLLITKKRLIEDIHLLYKQYDDIIEELERRHIP